MNNHQPSKAAQFISSSAGIYYDYLDKRGKGIQQIPVTTSAIDEHHLILTASVKLPNIDYISSIIIDGKEYYPRKFDFTIPENDKYSIYATLSIYNMNLFLTAKQIILINDFKQLVKRVELKFKEVTKFSLPQTTSTLTFDASLFSELNFSSLQIDSINNIFSAPVSYIWGAAGSGKTRYVLAPSIVTYLLNGKKVLLSAPTHVALENALSVIIPLAEAHGISRYQIRRAGSASESFIKQFPQCCRGSATESKINELKLKVKRISYYLELQQELEKAKEITSLATELLNAEEQQSKLQEELSNQQTELSLLNSRFQKSQTDSEFYRNTVIFLQKKQNSFSYKLKHLFRITKDISSEIYDYINKDKEVSDLIASLAALIAEKKEVIAELSNKSVKQQKDYKSLLKRLSSYDVEFSTSEQVLADYTQHIENVMIDIKAIEDYYPSIDFSSSDELAFIVKSLPSETEKLQSEKQDNLNSVLLYASTLDGLTGADSLEEFAHAFLDEACYACVAKASILFTCDCPITFLGDHLQLPPVFEMSEKDIASEEFQSTFIFGQKGIYSTDLFTEDFQLMYQEYINNSEKIPVALSCSELNITHRFGKKISEILDRFIYKNGFASALDNETEILILNAPRKTPTKKPRENIDEAKAICAYLSANTPEDYIVLAPYKDQITLLKQLLKNNDSVLTSHRSQGQEWDTVIFSVTDTNDKWFTSVTNSISQGKQFLNTTLSRARKTLVIVCDCNYWLTQKNQLITELIKIGKPLN